MDKQTEKRLLAAALRQIDSSAPPPWVSIAWPLLVAWSVVALGSFALFFLIPNVALLAYALGFMAIGVVVGWASFRIRSYAGWRAIRGHIDRQSVSARLRDLEA